MRASFLGPGGRYIKNLTDKLVGTVLSCPDALSQHGTVIRFRRKRSHVLVCVPASYGQTPLREFEILCETPARSGESGRSYLFVMPNILRYKGPSDELSYLSCRPMLERRVSRGAK